jgi:cytochrome c-type protein NapC
MSQSLIIAFLALAAVLALIVAWRVQFTRSREGKMLAFVVLLILPAVGVWGGFSEHMEKATSTQFCLSCHVMTDFGKSLQIDDKSYIPAAHFQNNRIPRDHACYTCHTDYTMFGTVNSKMRGLRHLWVQYTQTVPKPEAIKLYTPFNNRECLHCHLGARNFEEVSGHQKKPEQLANMKSGKQSCLSSGCHEFIHDVGSLKDAPMWKEKK